MTTLVDEKDVLLAKDLFEHAQGSFSAREETDRRRLILYSKLLAASPQELPSCAAEVAKLTRREETLLKYVAIEAQTLRRLIARAPAIIAASRQALPAKPTEPTQQRLEYQLHALEYLVQRLSRSLDLYEQSVSTIRGRLEKERELEEVVRAGMDPKPLLLVLRRMLELEEADIARLQNILGELPNAKQLVDNLGIGSVRGISFRTTSFLSVASGVSVLAGLSMASASIIRGNFVPEENLLGIGGVACLVAGVAMYLIRSSEYAQRVAVYEREARAAGFPVQQ